MTTKVQITNTGHLAVCVNVWEKSSPRDEGKNVERHDLKPGETTTDITVYSWVRGITIVETGEG